ncbi:MAG: hypothetical protein HY720_09250 [Planctomycetes bacterium]|nr:hypothetical protein [Planctomycetota bacterium]
MMAVTRKRGSIFLIASILVFIAIAMAGAFLMPSLVRYRGTMQNIEANRAFYQAEAGLSHSVDDLNAQNSGTLGSEAAPVDYGDGEYYVSTVDHGDYTYTITSTGIMEGTNRTVTAVAKRRLKWFWDNAIIAGPGASGSVINGNTTSHGGIFVFGEEADGTGDLDPDDVVFAFSGTGGVKDNYQDLSATLAAKIPPLTPTYPLETEIRVKNGQMNFSGTGSLGQDSGGTTDFIDGVYTADGTYGGTAGAGNVHSDNGAYENYDVPDSLTLPSVHEGYTDQATGTAYTDYEAYVAARGLDLDAALTAQGTRLEDLHPASDNTGSIGSGNKHAIDSHTNNISAFDGATWETSTNRIRWTKATGLLEIDGVIRMSSVTLGNKNGSMTYKGRGTIYVDSSGGGSGWIDIHGTILPQTTFPTVDVLGLVAEDEVQIAKGNGDSQTEMAVVIFAENEIEMAKQNQIAGTIISKYFNVGSNVPQLFAVPTLRDNLPPGFIYFPPIPTSVYLLSWQRGS